MSETKSCQNCKANFTIQSGDFDFYKKIDVPAPTFCPECRIMRRHAWRNERALSKVMCGLCKKSIFSMYRTAESVSYCRECYYSDNWDPMSYGKEYDFSRPFFEQCRDIIRVMPKLNLWHLNSTNSPYANSVKDGKNVYLSYSIVESEDIAYCKNVDRSQETFDSMTLMECERCFYGLYGTGNYDVNYSVFTRSCMNSWFLFDCVNARNCFMSSNLRNREYVFYNKQLSKEEYEAELTKINTGSYEVFQKLVSEFKAMYASSLHKYANITKAVNATGHVLTNVKNAISCFEVSDCEDIRHVARCLTLRDCMDTNNIGYGELIYEYQGGGNADRNLRMSVFSNGALVDCTYTGWCKSSSNLFGCFGVQSKQYCILNKQYTKEEYEALVPKIIKHMNEMPFTTTRGLEYRYGEFFPVELSPFAYNESVAQEYYSLSKEQIESSGYTYHELEGKNPQIDSMSAQLPDDSAQVGEDILQKTIGCEHAGRCVHQCTVGFRLTPQELTMYKRVKLPIPRQCPNCRYYERLVYRNPWKLWKGACMCAGNKSENGTRQNIAKHFHGENPCAEKFETSYAPGRPETLYCEQCYNAEVV